MLGHALPSVLPLPIGGSRPPSNKWFLEPTTQTTSQSVQPFCTAHGRLSSGVPGHLLSSKNYLCMGIWTPSNTCFLGSSRVHNPNSILIGSAVVAQLTSECHWACRGMPFPLKIVPSHGRVWTPSNTWFHL